VTCLFLFAAHRPRGYNPACAKCVSDETEGLVRTMLRWMLLILGSVLLAAGCGHPPDNRAAGMHVVVEDHLPFPAALAGTWKADRDGWEFTLAPDGSISAAILSLGRVRVVPGRTSRVPTKTGQEALFTPGPWTVQYIPNTRELTVRITMAHVRVELGGNLLEGSSTDVFTGPVSPADDTWKVEWTTFTHYTARTPEGKSFDLSTDPIYGETNSLVFTKTAATARMKHGVDDLEASRSRGGRESLSRSTRIASCRWLPGWMGLSVPAGSVEKAE
jgi:hypothetical protein